MLLVALTALTAGMRATEYDLWICGTQVTSDNASDLTGINGVGSDGALWYNASENALYMSYALIVSTSSSVSPIKVGSGLAGLTIKVDGVCTLVNSSNTGMGMSLENCGTLTITSTDDGILNVMGGALSSGFDILFTGSVLRIADGVTVNLLRGGIYNDGYWNETLNVDNANLYVHRKNATTPCIYMQNLAIQNAHLAMPYWADYTWNRNKLLNGDKEWTEDICIKAGAATYTGGSGGDVNGDNQVTLADVTALVNVILGKEQQTPDPTNGHEYVDLGLPSGTLWATCNIGASSPLEYGDYFAWGETKGYGQDDYSNTTNYASTGNYTKTEFSWSTYKWCQGEENTLTKYCSNAAYGYSSESSYLRFTDTKTSLDAVDDAAYQTWGSGWRIPTKEQWEELINYCTVAKGSNNNVNFYGYMGPNGNYIYLPCAGYRNDTLLKNDELEGYYWSRTLNSDSPSGASIWLGTFLYSYEGNEGDCVTNLSRYLGMPIRAVRASQ